MGHTNAQKFMWSMNPILEPYEIVKLSNINVDQINFGIRNSIQKMSIAQNEGYKLGQCCHPVGSYLSLLVWSIKWDLKVQEKTRKHGLGGDKRP